MPKKKHVVSRQPDLFVCDAVDREFEKFSTRVGRKFSQKYLTLMDQQMRYFCHYLIVNLSPATHETTAKNLETKIEFRIWEIAISADY